MSIFADGDNQGNPLESLVGEGKKYATAEDLAKSRIAADEHIARIEQENAEYRAAIQRDIQARQEQTLNTPPVNSPDQGNPPTQRDNQEDLAERIREITRQDRESEKTRNNIETVTSKLVDTFGSEEAANRAVKDKARELGVSLDFLMASAAASPVAFYKQMDLDSQARTAAAPRGTVNTAALQHQNPNGPKVGTYAFYESIRKSDPKLYNSPKVQLEMHKQAQENPNFFG
jgi:hypothetical protein